MKGGNGLIFMMADLATRRAYPPGQGKHPQYYKYALIGRDISIVEGFHEGVGVVERERAHPRFSAAASYEYWCIFDRIAAGDPP